MAATRSLDAMMITNQTPTEKDGRVMQRSRNVPRISETRRKSSLDEQPLEIRQFLDGVACSQSSSRTFLYLAYGSNLCAETFLGKRKIKPLSQINVVVPQLTLTFDLPGLPYKEPCFGNCRYRAEDSAATDSVQSFDYHKERWQKGMVGVVYEVTATDYAHIIATEGGGSGYQDVVIDCYPLDDDPTKFVPLHPTSKPFKAHTLFSPPTTRSRPDPAYAQPSARYKKLIIDGAEEHQLPLEYRDYLAGLRTYSITTIGQRIGLVVFLATWGPLFGVVFFGLSKILARKDGTLPKWFARIINTLFTVVWVSYDKFFKPVFGDGERTIEDRADQDPGSSQSFSDEKAELLHQSATGRRFGTVSETV